MVRTTLAAALLLTGGTVALGSQASAQDQQPEPAQMESQQTRQGPARTREQPQYSPSRGFNQVYQPIAAAANTDGANYAAAKAQIPAMQAAIQNADDRFLAGNVIYVLGLKLNEQPLQRQGMELMLASGKAPPAAVAEMNYFLGEWAYDAQQWAQARQYFQAARAAGYTEGNAEGLTVESYFREGQTQQGLAYLEQLVQQRAGAGQQVPPAWLRRGMRVALEAQDAQLLAKWSSMLVANNPSTESWSQALAALVQLQGTDKDAQLDLLRLMALTNSLTERVQYTTYIDVADPRAMANEVARVLESGLRAGVFTATDNYYVEAKGIVDGNAARDRADAPNYAAEARAAGGTARDAQNAGDVFLSLAAYAEAEEMYALGLQKGGADRDLFLTRLGIAQVQQGKLAEAKATLAQVSGPRSAVARMWTAYIDSRA